MSPPSKFNSRLDELDFLLNSLKRHERALRRIVERFEEIISRLAVSSKAEVSEAGSEGERGRLKGEMGGVILISGKRMLMVTKEELPKVIYSKLDTLVEYELDTLEKRSALEKLLSLLERKKKTGK